MTGPLPASPAGAGSGAPPAVHRWLRPLYDLHVRLRTEGDSPGRQAAAVGLGILVGCSPFYGLHLAICIALSSLFRLNRIQTYLAAQISAPAIAPLLIYAEIQVGRLLRGASWLSFRPAALRGTLPWQYGVDLLSGSLVVGTVLGLLAAFLTYRAVLALRKEPRVTALIEEAARRYAQAGPFSWEFVRGKLRYDPVYLSLLRSGSLPQEGVLCDLGCGRGIVLSLLATAGKLAERGTLPEGWPAPPRLTLHGIEGRPKHAAIARQALGAAATVVAGDLRDEAIPEADVLLLLDVLHYLDGPSQEELLGRIARALRPGGLLLIRDADAAGGWRFTATRLQERLSALARGELRPRFHYRSADAWIEQLEQSGLAASVEPMGMGTPYSNVLIQGKRRES
jgi:uncharacterized protein (DUF2062 family)